MCDRVCPRWYHTRYKRESSLDLIVSSLVLSSPAQSGVQLTHKSILGRTRRNVYSPVFQHCQQILDIIYMVDHRDIYTRG